MIVSLSAYLSYEMMRNLVLESLKQAALVEVQKGVDEIDEWLAERKTEIETIANTPTFRTMDWSIVGPYLKGEAKRLENYYQIAMVQPDGSYFTTRVNRTNRNLKDRPHIQQALKGRVVVSDPVISRSQGLPVVIVAAPVWQNAIAATEKNTQKIIGVNTGVIDIKQLKKVVENLKYGANSYAFALNSRGVPTVHPNPSLIGTPEKPTPSFLTSKNSDLRRIAEHMVKGKTEIQLAQVNGKEVYVTYIPLHQAQWSIALVIPRHNIENQLRPLDVMVLVIVGLAGITLVGLWQINCFEQNQLKKSKEAADAANRAKSEFLANISHELRTPLNGILGYAQILTRDGTLGVRQKNAVGVITKCGSHLLTLINEILELSKIEARKMELYPHNFHFPAFLQSVTEIFRIRAQQKGIDFTYSPDPQLPLLVYADEKRLRQILINLLGNAIKFTDTGGVNFQVKVLDREPSLPENSQESLTSIISQHQFSTFTIRLAIEDTGLGIASEQLEKIFSPFQRVRDEESRREGTGLGLAISQEIARMMGSQIQVSSQPGKGSVFWLDVKLHSRSQLLSSQINLTRKESYIIGYKGFKRKILVVDDKWENRSVLVNLLTPLGFEMLEARNAQEGLDKARENRPDLIIIDLVMPIMTGFEMLRHLQQSPQLPKIITIASSASVFESDRQKSLDAGADDFLPKPLQADCLLEMLRIHLHLKWIYETQNIVESGCQQQLYLGNKSLSAQVILEIVPPPQKQLVLLYDLAKQGLLHDILEYLEKLDKSDEKLIDFTREVRQLAKQFQVKKIQDFLEQYLAVN
ncbi:MAG: ATP-binding protein [Prochloraceae cyanobacterium]